MRMNTVVHLTGRDVVADPLTEILRQGAKQLIQQAVKMELQELLREHADHCMEDGKAGVVLNGYLLERELQTGIGPVTVQIPKVRSRTGEPVTFRSALVPPYVRKTGSLALKKSLVTIDAMGCQKNIAEAIVEKEGDYLLAVKDNQSRQKEAIAAGLSHRKPEAYVNPLINYQGETERNRDRKETRRCWTMTFLSKLDMVEDWKKLRV